MRCSILFGVIFCVALAVAANKPKSKARAGSKLNDLQMDGNFDMGGFNLGSIMCKTMDADKDGEITRAEMNNVYHKYKDQEDMINAACDVLQQMGIDRKQCGKQKDADGMTNLVLKKLDTDHNDVIDMEECAVAAGGIKMPNFGENLAAKKDAKPRKGRKSKPVDEL